MKQGSDRGWRSPSPNRGDHGDAWRDDGDSGRDVRAPGDDFGLGRNGLRPTAVFGRGEDEADAPSAKLKRSHELCAVAPGAGNPGGVASGSKSSRRWYVEGGEAVVRQPWS